MAQIGSHTMEGGIVEFLLQVLLNQGRSLFLLILCGTIGYCVYLLIRELQRQSSPASSVRRSARSGRKVRSQVQSNVKSRAKPAVSAVPSPNHPQYRKLVKLLNGDQRAAQRLVTSYQAKFPDKSDQWHYEKAIYDLSRDRH